MSVLNWNKPKKARSTTEHNRTYSSDTNIPGTYVPNMSEEDNQRWKAKYIGGENPRVEIRRCAGAQMLVTVYKDGGLGISANGRVYMSPTIHTEFLEVLNQAREALERGGAPREDQAPNTTDKK